MRPAASQAPLSVAVVSEHASPLAGLGSEDAGGQNVHVAALSRALAARGHRVTVFTRRDDPELPARVTFAPGVDVVHLDAGPARHVPKDELVPYLSELEKGLHAELQQLRPDVVHAHFWMSGLVSLLPAAALGVPLVQTFHALGAVKAREQGRDDTSPEHRIDAERYVGRAAAGVVATCRDEVHELVSLGLDAAGVQVVPCGVDTEMFSPQGPTRTRGRRFRLLSVGRLVPRKGIRDVLAAVAQIADAELVVVGGPPSTELDEDPHAADVVNEAGRLGISDRVRLFGQASHDDVATWMRASDLVICAPWYEPFGIVPLEAMACGVPVIGTAVGGLLDTVVDGVTGLLVPPRSPDRLVDAVRQLVDSPVTRRRMGHAGRARVLSDYTWPRVAVATEQAYRNFGARPRRAPMPVEEPVAVRS